MFKEHCLEMQVSTYQVYRYIPYIVLWVWNVCDPILAWVILELRLQKESLNKLR